MPYMGAFMKEHRGRWDPFHSGTFHSAPYGLLPVFSLPKFGQETGHNKFFPKIHQVQSR